MTNVWCDVNGALLFLVTEIKTPHENDGILSIYNIPRQALDTIISVPVQVVPM